MSKKIIQRCVTVCCLAIFIYSLFQLIEIFWGYSENRKVLAEIQELYEIDGNDEDKQSNSDSIRSPFIPLLQVNEDIVGWITIEGTRIDYPILQSENNDYYLYRNYKHEESRAGSIFMDYRNDLQSYNRNTILYGHRMKDGSMFAKLNKWLDKDYFFENQYFSYDTLYGSYGAEIFSVYQTSSSFYYIQTDFSTDKEYGDFLKEIKGRSQVESGVELTEDDTIITLSTCDYWHADGRLVVHAKLTPNES